MVLIDKEYDGELHSEEYDKNHTENVNRELPEYKFWLNQASSRPFLLAPAVGIGTPKALSKGPFSRDYSKADKKLNFSLKS